MTTAIDKHVGKRLRERRGKLGIARKTLAISMGITLGQLRKNELGINRLAAGRLFDAAEALAVPIQFFFDEMPVEIEAFQQKAQRKLRAASRGSHRDLLSLPETIELLRVYHRIGDARSRRRVYRLALSLAATTSRNGRP